MRLYEICRDFRGPRGVLASCWRSSFLASILTYALFDRTVRRLSWRRIIVTSVEEVLLGLATGVRGRTLCYRTILWRLGCLRHGPDNCNCIFVVALELLILRGSFYHLWYYN